MIILSIVPLFRREIDRDEKGDVGTAALNKPRLTILDSKRSGVFKYVFYVICFTEITTYMRINVWDAWAFKLSLVLL